MDGIAHGARTALLSLPMLLASQAIADTQCPIDISGKHYDETARVRYIYDGDTLQLSDGRKIRLIGINTPELARKNKPAEAYAREAKNALTALFKENKNIRLLHGKDPRDRYGRVLAHGFLADGQNIQALLLNQGYARAVNFPPNLRYASCYQTQETNARCNNIGLWKNTEILQAKQLKKQHIGFQLVQGELKSIRINKKGIWLNVDNKLTVGIRPDNRPLFDINAIKRMQQQKITVRGWLNKSNKATPFYMRIRQPSAIQLSRDFACS